MCIGAETVEGVVVGAEICITFGVQFSSPAEGIIFEGVLYICWDVSFLETICWCIVLFSAMFSSSQKSSCARVDAVEEIGEKGLRTTADSVSRPLNVKFLSNTLLTINTGNNNATKISLTKMNMKKKKNQN